MAGKGTRRCGKGGEGTARKAGEVGGEGIGIRDPPFSNKFKAAWRESKVGGVSPFMAEECVY